MIEVRAARADEYEAVARLCDRAFLPGLPPEQWAFPPDPASGDAGRSVEHNMVRVVTTAAPDFDAEHLRVAVDDGRVVAMALFIACRLRIGRAVVPANLAGPVAVDPDVQRRGHGTAVMQDAVTAMGRAGHLLSQLWGHPGYYERFGYSPAVPFCTVLARVDELDIEAVPPFRVVPFSPDHIPHLVALWHDNTAQQCLADVRDEAAWRWAPQVAAADYGLLLDTAGATAGYYQAVAGAGRVQVFDAGVAGHAAAVALLAHLRGLARDWGAESLELRLSPEHPLARAAWQHGACLQTAYSPAGFVRVLDLPGLFDCLREEFDRRLGHSELHSHSGMLAVRTDSGEAATLALRGGLVSGVMARAVVGAPLLELPLAQLNPLVTGLRPLDEILSQPGVSLAAGARRLAEIMFPAGQPLPTIWPIEQS